MAVETRNPKMAVELVRTVRHQVKKKFYWKFCCKMIYFCILLIHATQQANIQTIQYRNLGHALTRFEIQIRNNFWGFKNLLKIFSLNHVFTDHHLTSISDQRTIRDEVVRVFLHGHSIYDEAAFYELYMMGVIDSKHDLDNFLRSLIPGFKGLSQKEFDMIMAKWLYHLLANY